MDLQNKLAVITGAANGIGKSIAIYCAIHGCKIALIDLNKSALYELNIALNNLFSTEIHSFECDVSKESNIKRLVQDIKIKFNTNSIQLLFNNVGLSALNTTILNGDMNKLHKLMNINMWSMIYGTRHFLPLLMNNDPSIQCYIVNTGSTASVHSADSFYCVTKQAVLAISETIQKELNHLYRMKNRNNNNRQKIKCNILVSTLCPGPVRTDLFKSSGRILLNDEQFNKVYNDLNEQDVKKKVFAVNSSMPNTILFDKMAIEPNKAVEYLFEGLKQRKTVITTNKAWFTACVKDRMESVLNGTPNKAYELNKVIVNALHSKL
eukprot:74708_1